MGLVAFIQPRLVRELEKKFSGRPVVFIAQRRILPKPKRKQRTRQKQLRPRRWVSGTGSTRFYLVHTSTPSLILDYYTFNAVGH